MGHHCMSRVFRLAMDGADSRMALHYSLSEHRQPEHPPMYYYCRGNISSAAFESKEALERSSWPILVYYHASLPGSMVWQAPGTSIHGGVD